MDEKEGRNDDEFEDKNLCEKGKREIIRPLK